MYLFFLSFLSGSLVKLADDIEDRKIKIGRGLMTQGAWLIAIIYGLVIGYIISQASFSMLFLAALFAQALAGKLDQKSHILGFLIAIISAAYFGLPTLEQIPFAIFLIAAYLDELTLFGKWKTFTDYRLFLKIAALAFIVIGRLDYFISIIAFDMGYILVEKYAK